ncbi:hypothetical protein ACA910_009416 [Epithemia clementina (nom. ined.)]
MTRTLGMAGSTALDSTAVGKTACDLSLSDSLVEIYDEILFGMNFCRIFSPPAFFPLKSNKSQGSATDKSGASETSSDSESKTGRNVDHHDFNQDDKEAKWKKITLSEGLQENGETDLAKRRFHVVHIAVAITIFLLLAAAVLIAIGLFYEADNNKKGVELSNDQDSPQPASVQTQSFNVFAISSNSSGSNRRRRIRFQPLPESTRSLQRRN